MVWKLKTAWCGFVVVVSDVPWVPKAPPRIRELEQKLFPRHMI